MILKISFYGTHLFALCLHSCYTYRKHFKQILCKFRKHMEIVTATECTHLYVQTCSTYRKHFKHRRKFRKNTKILLPTECMYSFMQPCSMYIKHFKQICKFRKYTKIVQEMEYQCNFHIFTDFCFTVH